MQHLVRFHQLWLLPHPHMILCGCSAELERLTGRLPHTYLKRQDADWRQLLPLLDGEQRVLYPQHLHHECNQGVAGMLGRRMDSVQLWQPQR